jgi:hypothetical protein
MKSCWIPQGREDNDVRLEGDDRMAKTALSYYDFLIVLLPSQGGDLRVFKCS